MKKYNKPEIETLALETVDVIAASATATVAAVNGEIVGSNQNANIQGNNDTISTFVDTNWQW